MNLRKLTDDDRPLIDEQIAADPFHAGKGDASFFFEPYSEAFSVSDSEGVVMHVRISRALRVNAVFSGDRKRNAEVMKHLAKALENMAKDAGFREVIFTSANEGLRQFGTTIGFHEEPTLVMAVEPVERADSPSKQ